jgi:hypothetical protein
MREKRHYTLSIFHLVLLTSLLFFLNACRAKHTNSLRKMYPGELRPEREIALVLTSDRDIDSGSSDHYEIIEIDGINTERLSVIEVEPGTYTCSIQLSGSSSYMLRPMQYTTHYKSTSALKTTFTASAGYVYYPSGRIFGSSNTWEPKVMRQPIELTLPPNYTCLGVGPVGSRSFKLEIWRHYRSKGDVKDIQQ